MRRCSGTGRYISSGIARSAARARSAVARPLRRAMVARAPPPARAPRPGCEEALERHLVLPEWGAIELALDVSAEGGVAEREREGACQELGAGRLGEDARLAGRSVGRGARWAVGTGERSGDQREPRHA